MARRRIREPLTTPELCSIASDVRRIRFRHPAYPESTPDMLCLSAVDGNVSQGPVDNGIDYDVAFTACCIVTGNTWRTGWLALRHPQTGAFVRVSREDDDALLRSPIYYFCIGDGNPLDHKYPVLPSFDHWRFPHDELPHPWADLRIRPFTPHPPSLKGKLAAEIRDEKCCITNHAEATETAHLVPRSAGYWFRVNNMERYCRLPYVDQPIDDERNLVLLRRDIRWLFDQRRFTVIAKEDGAQSGTEGNETGATIRLVAHILLPQASTELVSLYHNLALRDPRCIAREFLFARFAWAIFTDENLPFFTGASLYTVLLFDPRTGESKLAPDLYSLKVREKAKLFATHQSKSRSVNSKTSARDERDDNDDDNSIAQDESLEPGRQVQAMEEEDWPPRGRRRKRTHGHKSPPGLAHCDSSLSGSCSSIGTRELLDTSLQNDVPIRKFPSVTSCERNMTDNDDDAGSQPPLKRRLFP